MSSNRLIVEVEPRVIEIDVEVVLAHHQVCEETAVRGNQICADERDLNGIVEAVVVALLRAEITGGGPQVDIPSVPVQARDVGADLDTGEALMSLVRAVYRHLRGARSRDGRTVRNRS